MRRLSKRQKAVRYWPSSSQTTPANKFSLKWYSRYMMDSVTWKIGGEAGFGIMSSGTMLARTFSRAGYHVLATNEYPSLIRGGHNLVTVRIATDKFEAMNRDLHILVALNRETVDLHKQELSENALVIYDPKDGELTPADFPKPVKLIPIPLTELVTKLGGEPVMRN